MASSSLAIAVGAFGLSGIGLFLLRQCSFQISKAERLALAFALGIGAAVPAVVFVSSLHVPFASLAVLVAMAAIAAAFYMTTNWRINKTLFSPLSCLFWLGIGIDVFKIERFPLWTWDYYAIWGVKARRLLTGGVLDLSFLSSSALAIANPGYPIGLPVTNRVMSLGQDLLPVTSKLEHLIFSAAALLAARATLRIITDVHYANAWATYLAMSVLFWDTELVGIAEVPLALFTIAAIFFVLQVQPELARGALPAGITMGFLAWIKDEGIVLCVALACVTLLLHRKGKRTAMATIVIALTLAGIGRIYQALVLPRGLSFWAGDWPDRLSYRLHHPALVVAPLVHDLSSWNWLGLWPLFVLAIMVAIARKYVRAIALLSIVTAQLAIYVLIYFVSYIDPAQHIVSSFHRITAACAPVAILGIADAFTSTNPDRARRRH